MSLLQGLSRFNQSINQSTNLFYYASHTTKADFQVGLSQTHVTKNRINTVFISIHAGHFLIHVWLNLGAFKTFII